MIETVPQYEGQIQFSIVEQSVDSVTAEMPVQGGIISVYGVVSAGAILWFADVTATALLLEGRTASKSMRGFPLAINLTANLASNQSDGSLIAKSSIVKRGKTVSIVRTKVTGKDGKLIADVTTNHIPAK